MSRNFQWYLLSSLLLFSTLCTTSKAANLILEKNDGGHEECKEYNPSSHFDGIDHYAILEDKIRLIVAKPVSQLTSFPIIIRAFDEFGTSIGESDEISESSLSPHHSIPDLLVGEIHIEMKFYSLRPYFDLLRDCVNNKNARTNFDLEITYKIFSGENELSEKADIYNHPNLKSGSNILRTFVSICCGIENTVLSSKKFQQHKFILEDPKVKIQESKGIIRSVFPNPSKTNASFTIVPGSTKFLDIKIVSALGIDQFSKRLIDPTGNIQIETTGWVSGYYYILMNTPLGKEVYKLMILE